MGHCRTARLLSVLCYFAIIYSASLEALGTILFLGLFWHFNFKALKSLGSDYLKDCLFVVFEGVAVLVYASVSDTNKTENKK